MIQSTVVFGKFPLAHHLYINFHLISFDLYAQSILHQVLKHDLILRTNQFTNVRCKKRGDFTIFSKSSTVIFITINPWCKILNISMWWFQEMTVNTAMWLNRRQQVFKGFKIIFLYYRNVLLVFRAALKRLAFKSSAMCYIMKTKNVKL